MCHIGVSAFVDVAIDFVVKLASNIINNKTFRLKRVSRPELKSTCNENGVYGVRGTSFVVLDVQSHTLIAQH